jgi:hypothetical protein
MQPTRHKLCVHGKLDCATCDAQLVMNKLKVTVRLARDSVTDLNHHLRELERLLDDGLYKEPHKRTKTSD